MSTNTPTVFNRDDCILGKQMLENLIATIWQDLYIGTHRIIHFRNTIEFPSTAQDGMRIRISRDHIDVIYGESTMVIDWEINDKSGKCEKFLFSSNWNNFTGLFVPVQQTLIQHLKGLFHMGAA